MMQNERTQKVSEAGWQDKLRTIWTLRVPCIRSLGLLNEPIAI
jgi:hypothetical protein